jgi:CRISPR-associated protein Csb1
MQLTADRLIDGCRDEAFDAGISISTLLEPLAGSGTPVKPAIYAGGVFQMGKRWWGSGDSRKVVDVIVIDNIPSQANRVEAALKGLRAVLGLPELVLDLSSVAHLPAHLPRSLSSFEFPHRNADAYLRDAELDGEPFLKTPQGAAIVSAAADRPEALLEWMPQALVFGFWQSHLGKKRLQTKLARSYVSEIVGFEPAATDVRTFGIKGDPLNLSIDVALVYDEDNQVDWDIAGGEKAKGTRQKDSLAEVGHGQVPFAASEATLNAVSFVAIEQRSALSFAGLRRITCENAEASAPARALLAAITIAGHVAAFGRAMHLRSGADLRPVETCWEWLPADGRQPLEPPSLDDARELVRACAERAQEAGLPVGAAWPAPLTLTPQRKLVSVIEKSWPLGDDF